MTAWLLAVAASAAGGLVLGALLARLLAPAGRRTERTAVEQVEFMRNLLAFLLVAAFVGCLPTLTFKAIPAENKDLLTYMLGQLSGMATMALGFYFVNKAGQDAADAQKTENTGKLAEAITETARAAQAAAPGDSTADAAAGARQAADAAEEVTEQLEQRAGPKPEGEP